VSLDVDKVYKERHNTPLSKYRLMKDPILVMVPRSDNAASAVEVGNNMAAAVEGEVATVKDEAMTLVDNCKGEDMVDMVRIFWGLREDKVVNVAWGSTCMV
jgi:hypothetical protein